MFWKKKKTDPEMFTLETENERNFFRVFPAEDKPMAFEVGPAEDEPTIHNLIEKRVWVIDISASGLSFKNRGFREKKSYPITFDLPGRSTTISTALEIISISEDGICHSRFKGLAEETSDKIHEYVLERQKKIIRTEKG